MSEAFDYDKAGAFYITRDAEGEPTGYHRWPPLATLDEKPLHDDGEPLPEGHEWWCQILDHEEDSRTFEPHYDWRCSECVQGARLRVIWPGDTVQEWRLTNDSEPQLVKLSWLVDRATYWQTHN